MAAIAQAAREKQKQANQDQAISYLHLPYGMAAEASSYSIVGGGLASSLPACFPRKLRGYAHTFHAQMASRTRIQLGYAARLPRQRIGIANLLWQQA